MEKMMSEQPKDGGPAFPQIKELADICVTNNGMSLRDWFAGQALAGIMANCDEGGASTWAPSNAADRAFQCADAMLAARGTP